MSKTYELCDIQPPKDFGDWYTRLFQITLCDNITSYTPENYDNNIDKIKASEGPYPPGSLVEIDWSGEALDGMMDEGYILTLPTMDNDDIWMSGIVHIPEPAGGEGNEPVWAFIGDLVANPLVKEIRFFRVVKNIP